MLDPKKDRIDYGEKLIPPEGYELDYAIGTSYSLDLKMLIFLPIALYNSQTFDTAKDEIGLLDYISNAAKKIKIFCQKGKISVPKNFSYLFAYWEDSIVEILPDHHRQSFHPKVWIIRFIKENSPTYYKLLVTSRNLTFATDWDISFDSEGFVGEQEQVKSKPLVDFIEFLFHNSSSKISDKFISDLKKVDFRIPDGFRLMNFHPIGVPRTSNGSNYNNPLQNKKWEELLAISPFLDNKTVRRISNATNKKIAILSVKEELSNLSKKVLDKLESYKFSDNIRMAAFKKELVEESYFQFSQELHSKLFIGRKQKENFWYLGSANLTDPAFGRNIEFMVELKSNMDETRPSRILRSFTKPNDNDIVLFEPFRIENTDDAPNKENIELDLQEIVYNITKLQIKGDYHLFPNTNTYELSIYIDASNFNLKKDYTVKLKLLSSGNSNKYTLRSQKKNEIIIPENLTETQLTPFIHWEIQKNGEVVKQFLTKMEIDLPKDTRLRKILTTIINSREKFLKYIIFLIQGESAQSLFDYDDKNDKSTRAHKVLSNYSIPGIPIFENLLLAVSRSPKKLGSIDKLVNQLKEENDDNTKKILTPEFERFWEVFKEFAKYES